MITHLILILKYSYKYIITMVISLPRLEEIGLSRNEAAVYTTLLGLGETKTGAIVKKTGMHRVLIYDALDALIEKGLATSVIKENRKYFQAMDPGKLLDFLKEKQKIAESLLPELNTMKDKSKVQQQVAIYSGVKGLKTAFNGMLKEISPDGTYHCFASGFMERTSGLGKKYNDEFQKRKRGGNIKAFVIYYGDANEQKDIIENAYGTIRHSPINYFPTTTYIYEDKVLVIICTANPPFAVLITNKQTAESYRKLFSDYWKKARILKDDLGPK